jgi:hypothetical protein
MVWCKEKEAETKGQEVRKMLEGLGLSQYADSLIEEHGFERIAWFNNVQDLPTKCGVKVGHAEAIMLEVRKKAGVNKKATTSPVSVESDTEKDEVLDDEDRPARKNKKKRARLASADDGGNYVPSSWTEIESEWSEFQEARDANPKKEFGTQRFRIQKKKKYSASALGRWGHWLVAMDAAGATAREMDAEKLPVSLRGLDQWKEKHD